MHHCITGFITLGYTTLVQQIYWLRKILLVYTLQSTVLHVCVQLQSLFITAGGRRWGTFDAGSVLQSEHDDRC